MNIFPRNVGGDVRGKPSTGLPSGTKISKTNVVGDPIRGIVDPYYAEWESNIIKDNSGAPTKETQTFYPTDLLPSPWDVNPPAIFMDEQHKYWVWNDCNKRWWTPDYTDATSKGGGSGIVGHTSGMPTSPAQLMWTTRDNLMGGWIRRRIDDWCNEGDGKGNPIDPGGIIPPMDDCEKYGINCPEPMPTGKVFTRIASTDKLPTRLETTTYGIWTDNVGNMTQFFTCSMSASIATYHQVVYNNSCSSCNSFPQFDLAYGHFAGSGSADLGGFDYLTPTKAIYGQYRLLCLGKESNKFKIGNKELDQIYVVNIRRDRMRERVDEGNIELNLHHLNGLQFGGANQYHTGSNVLIKSGSGGDPTGEVIRLIDDSTLDLDSLSSAAFSGFYSDFSGSRVHQSTQAGKVYRMVSGSLEKGIYNSTQPEVYGLFYPYLGVVVLDGDALDATGSFFSVTGSEVAGDNAHKIFTAISGAAGFTDESGDTKGFQARAKVTEFSEYYFIRVKNGDYNFTNNPTFITGSDGTIIDNFIEEPKVYFTTVGLYNERKELVAVGKVSQALQKTCTSEALFRVKIKY